MNRQFVLQKLRESYIKKDIPAMKRQLVMGSFVLTEDDKQKVLNAITDLENGVKHTNPLIKQALEMLGGRIIE